MVSARLSLGRHFQVVGFLTTICFSAGMLLGGSLTPPGTPAPTMKTLDQVEPRKPISSLPYNITSPGSYYVTGNLQGGTISVMASGVTIDLCGFTLSGAGVVASGIAVSGGSSMLTVRNGRLVSFSQNGINGASGTTTGTLLQDLVVADCGNTGLVSGMRSTLINCVAESNRYHGIYAGEGSIIARCTSKGNGSGSSGNGIEVARNSRVVDCVSTGNEASGIMCAVACSVQGCTSFQNKSIGINVGTGSVVSLCCSRENLYSGIGMGQGCTVSDCSVSSNTYVGIYSGDRCQIERCTVTECAMNQAAITTGFHSIVRQCEVTNNWSTGISVNSNCFISLNNCSGNGRQGSGVGISVGGSGSRVEDNNVCGNPSGIICNGTSNSVLRNTMQGNTSNYTQGTGNIWGTIVTTEAAMNSATNSNVNIALP